MYTKHTVSNINTYSDENNVPSTFQKQKKEIITEINFSPKEKKKSDSESKLHQITINFFQRKKNLNYNSIGNILAIKT